MEPLFAALASVVHHGAQQHGALGADTHAKLLDTYESLGLAALLTQPRVAAGPVRSRGAGAARGSAGGRVDLMSLKPPAPKSAQAAR